MSREVSIPRIEDAPGSRGGRREAREGDPRRAVIGLGANLGEPERSFVEAIARIEALEGVELLGRSSLYDTEPVGPPQPRYLNAAILVRSSLEPSALLELLLGVEAALGRDRAREERWGPRLLDLDILWMEEVELDSPGLTLPHPRLGERSFALAPLLEVASFLAPTYLEALEKLGGSPPRRPFT